MKFQVSDIIKIKEAIVYDGEVFKYFGELIVEHIPKERRNMVDAIRKDEIENRFLENYFLGFDDIILIRRAYNEISSG